MSGGSMGYAYQKIEGIIEACPVDTQERFALVKHMQKLVVALEAVEWNLSGDGPRDENAAIRELLGVPAGWAIVPELDHDAYMLKRFGHKVHPEGRLERRIVANLIEHLRLRGWNVHSVFDGEAHEGASNAKEAMEVIFNLDEAHVYFRNSGGRRYWVLLILGNGTDIISDHVDDSAKGGEFYKAMDAFDAEKYA